MPAHDDGVVDHTGRDDRRPPPLLHKASHVMSSAPGRVGTATVLMAGLDLPSRAEVRDADAERAVSARVHQVLTDLGVSRPDGPVVHGDEGSSMAVFVHAGDAVASALQLQIALAGAAVPVCAALHTGEVRRRGASYAGPVIDRCRRLRAAAYGGQVLCSQLTADLASGSLPDGVSLVHLGAHRLRDLGPAEPIVQVSHPLLTGPSGVLRTLDTTPNNLPVELTTFVGRRPDLATTMESLDDHRLVSLTGSGGCGKTRLALQVAAERIDAHPDGVWFVALATLSDVSAVPRAVLDVVPADTSAPGQGIDALIARISDRRCLLVLDNCEHVIDAAAELVDALLRRCPGVRVLATTREPLGVSGEVTCRVPSLTLPPSDVSSWSLIESSEAVQLFEERARRARPTFELAEDNAASVAEICRRLDGLPFAIELAAARMRVLSPRQILEGLHDRFRLLTGGVRTALARQQTLEASLDWSYDLLLEPERAVLRRLAVFNGGFTLAAAEEVCAQGPVRAHHVLELLSQLVDKSLVVTDDETSGRFRLLETMRHYAARRLSEHDETAETTARHFAYFARFARREQTETDQEFRARISRDYDNLRRALQWAGEQDDPTLLATLASRLHGYWTVSTHLAEALAWTQQAGRGLADVDDVRRARTLVRLARLAVLAEDLPTAAAAAEDAVTSLRVAGEQRTLVDALTVRAQVGGADATSYADEAVAIAEQLDDPPLLAYALAIRGAGGIPRPWDRADASDAVRRSIEIAQACGASHTELIARGTLGILATYDCEPRVAVEHLSHVIPGLRAAGDGYFLSMCLVNLADNLVRLGDFDGAEACHAELAAIADRLGPVRLSSPRVGLGHLALARGDAAAAAEHYRDPGFTPRWLAGLWEGRRALSLLLCGDVDGARHHLDEFLARFDRALSSSAWPLAVRALVARADDDLPLAERLAQDAVAASPADPHTLTIANSLAVLAAIRADLGHHDSALRLCAAVERFTQERDIVMLPAIGDLLHQAADRSMQALAQEDAERAWCEGSAMTLTGSVSHVTRGRGPRKRPATGWGSLTPTELEVVELVTEGLSNPEIADRLLVARRTVTTHLTSIFRKLAISSRAELAAQAARRTVDPGPP